MFIANVENHKIILNKSWMNQRNLSLNIKSDSLIFFQEILLFSIKLSNNSTVSKSTNVDLNVFILNLK